MTLSNASAGANIGSPALATVTINDEDPTPTLAISNVSQNEGNSGTTPFAFSDPVCRQRPERHRELCNR